jgi:hypothetical protein
MLRRARRSWSEIVEETSWTKGTVPGLLRTETLLDSVQLSN